MISRIVFSLCEELRSTVQMEKYLYKEIQWQRKSK